MTDWSATPKRAYTPRGSTSTGRYLGFPITVTNSLVTAFTHDRRRVIATATSYAGIRSAIRGYRSGSKR